jgi:hypothetical protein
MAHAHCMLDNRGYRHTLRICNTIQLHVSGLIGTASHQDKQKIRKTGFFFENKLYLQFEVGKSSTNGYFRLNIYLRTNNTAHHLKSTQPPSRLNGSCQRPRESCAKQSVGEEGAGVQVMTVNFRR